MIYVITGPTGSGKSQLARRIALQTGAHVINADAMQVYIGMDIGTNKDCHSLFADIPTHLFDIRKPDEGYDVATYQLDARAIIDDLSKKNIPIVIVGGSGLYIRAALFDYVFPTEKPTDEMTYEDVDTVLLFARLQEVDPGSAVAIHQNNRRRIVRALRIYDGTGTSKSAHLDKQAPLPLYPATFVAIDVPRQELYDRVDRRVLDMVNQGLVDEVKRLMVMYGKDARGLQAIGYKEMMVHINGQCSLNEAIATTQQATRRYVKRQLTFFRHQLPIHWFSNSDSAFEYLLKEHDHG